jgi:chaperone modulatory protein CbpM
MNNCAIFRASNPDKKSRNDGDFREEKGGLARIMDFDMDEPLTPEIVAASCGTKRSLVLRLAYRGLIETLESDAGEPRLPRRAVVQLRRMQRLRRDLGVNFAGASVILDLVQRLDRLNRELLEMRARFRD